MIGNDLGKSRGRGAGSDPRTCPRAALGVGLSAALVLLACEAPSPGTFISPAPEPTTSANAPSGTGGHPSDGGVADAKPLAVESVVEGEAILDVTSAGYRASSRFTHVSAGPYASTAAAGKTIDLWVSSDAYAQYALVRPDLSGSNASLPRGSVIIREVHDASGTLTAVTAMFKGEDGFNPVLGDWGFISAPLADAAPVDGGVSAGRTTECFGCHIPRSGDDYLFGVPPAARPTADAGADAHAFMDDVPSPTE